MILLRSFLSGHIRIKRTREYYDAGIGPNVPFGAIGVSPVVSQNFLTNTTVPSWMDVSATTGNRMLYDSTGKLTYAPNNMLTYSEQFDNAAWSKLNATVTANSIVSPDGTQTADTVTTSGTANSQRVSQTPTSTGPLVFSIYAKAGSAQYLQLMSGSSANVFANFDLTLGVVGTAGSSTSATISNVGNGWYRCAIYANLATAGIFGAYISPSASAVYASAYSASVASLYLWGAQLEAVTYQTLPSTYIPTTTAAYYGPRFDYDPSTLAAKGLLIEESRINLCTYSQDIANAAWVTKTNVVITADQIAAPDGTTTADQLADDATNGTHRIGCASIAFASGTTYTLSVYAKAGTDTLVQLTFSTGTHSSGPYANFNLSNGTVTQSAGTGIVSGVQSVGNGWYRCFISAPADLSASTNFLIHRINSATATRGPAYAGTGTTIYLWGAQLEAGSFATSYIPTTTASVTRAADIIKLSGAALTAVTGAQSSIITQASTFGQSGPTPIPTMVNISDGTTANYIRVNTGTGYGGRLFVTTGAVNQVNSTTGAAPTDNQTFRIGVAVKLNDFGVSYNGGAVSTDTAGTVPTMTQAAIGNWYTSASTFLNGYVQSIALYNQRLPNATLQTKSTVGSPL